MIGSFQAQVEVEAYILVFHEKQYSKSYFGSTCWSIGIIILIHICNDLMMNTFLSSLKVNNMHSTTQSCRDRGIRLLDYRLVLSIIALFTYKPYLDYCIGEFRRDSVVIGFWNISVLGSTPIRVKPRLTRKIGIHSSTDGHLALGTLNSVVALTP